MSETLDSDQDGPDANERVPAWSRAVLDDIRDLDFEGPVTESTSAECSELSDLFRIAASIHEKLGDEAGASAARVFVMLSSLTDLHFKPEDRNEPYGAMFTMPDGRRSAVPEDFRGESAEVLVYAAEHARHPTLRARLSDISWMLDRKHMDLGLAAIDAFVEIVEKLDSGTLQDRLENEDAALGLVGRDAIRRALQIGRTIDWDSDESSAARDWAVKLRRRAIISDQPVHVDWFAEMDLDFGVSDPKEIAEEVERFLQVDRPDANSHAIVELWRLAARACHNARDEEGESRCRAGAAECLVAQAEAGLKRQSPAMLAAHLMSSAIAELHGVPGMKERRTELRHRLVDIQSSIPEEMSSFSQPMDLNDIADQVEKQIDGLCLVDLLLKFAALSRSPEPNKLTQDALTSIRNFPLSSLFGTSFLDREGKVVHRTEGGGLSDDQSEPAIRVHIARHEQIRRSINSFGILEVARQRIIERHHLSDCTFRALLRHSPFVPDDLIGTFSRGFNRYFQGDFVSAIYVLTPLLENSLRHVLKLNGHDVTTFDDTQQVQQDRSMSALFHQMRPELDDIFGQAITTDIDNVFLSKPGPCIRHAVAHGLLHDYSPFGADAIYACWLIYRLCCIPLFPHREMLEIP